MEIRPKFSMAAAPIERPLPLWILYPLFFVVIYLSHWSLLRLPFFWDEAGYYIPAALDLFRTGALIPHSTVTNAHPPLPSLLLAAWWHIAGFVISGTRTFLCMVAAAALLGVFRLARLLAGTPVAAAVTALTALYPVWFTQSTLAHADLFAAAFTLWALSFYFERHSLATAPGSTISASAPHLAAIALLFSLAALSKETAVVTPIALGLWEIVLLLTERNSKSSSATLMSAAALFAPILPLLAWYAFHYHQTGFIFGNPEFLRYNATANLGLARTLVSLWHRIVHLTLHMNMYVPVIATIAVLRMPQLPERSLPATRKPALLALCVVIAANLLAFSVLGGALLTRYLLPIYPLLLLILAALWHQRLRQWWWLATLSAAAFLAALFVNPPYAFAPEDNLTYRDMVLLHQQGIRLIEQRFPQAIVLSAWPATAELQSPSLGYTQHPVAAVAISNFSREQVQQAAADPGAYDTAFVFSTKWAPPPGSLDLGRRNEQVDQRFFDFHRDLSPPEIASLLGGQIIWQQHRRGEWAAVLRFPRALEVRLITHPPAAPSSPALVRPR